MPLRPTLYLAALFFALLGLFTTLPHLDIAVSHLFFDEQRGFFLARQPFLLAIHYGVPFLTKTLLILYVLLLITWVCFRWSPKFLPPRVVLYLLVALVIGPGLVVSVFKNDVGRARPDEIVAFHGTKQFSKPFEISDQCKKNCSFISGHSAMGFYFLTFAFIAGKHRRKVFAVAFAFGCAVAASRVMMGKHFLSDVVFSGYFVYLSSFILYYSMLFRKRKTL